MNRIDIYTPAGQLSYRVRYQDGSEYCGVAYPGALRDERCARLQDVLQGIALAEVAGSRVVTWGHSETLGRTVCVPSKTEE